MGDMDDAASETLEQVEKHLNNPNQAWLLGAGIGFDANIPLMVHLLSLLIYSTNELDASAPPRQPNSPATLDVLTSQPSKSIT